MRRTSLVALFSLFTAVAFGLPCPLPSGQLYYRQGTPEGEAALAACENFKAELSEKMTISLEEANHLTELQSPMLRTKEVAAKVKDAKSKNLPLPVYYETANKGQTTIGWKGDQVLWVRFNIDTPAVITNYMKIPEGFDIKSWRGFIEEGRRTGARWGFIAVSQQPYFITGATGVSPETVERVAIFKDSTIKIMDASYLAAVVSLLENGAPKKPEAPAIFPNPLSSPASFEELSAEGPAPLTVAPRTAATPKPAVAASAPKATSTAPAEVPAALDPEGIVPLPERK